MHGRVEQSFVKYANIYYSIASSHYAKGLQSNYANYSAAAVQNQRLEDNFKSGIIF